MASLCRSAGAMAWSTARLFQVYFKSLVRVFTLPRELYDKQHLDDRMSTGKPFVVHIPHGRDYVEQHEEELDRLSRSLSESWPINFATKQTLFWLIRLATIACALTGRVRPTVLASLLQFVVLPYSFFASVATGGETVLMLYAANALVFPVLQFALRMTLPAWLGEWSLALGPRFMLLFLLTNQLVCALCLWWTPCGKTAPMSARRIANSIFYGFLNCKTYYLIVFPVAFGVEIPVLAWVVDAALGLSWKLGSYGNRYWEILFYHAHRMGHLKHVYTDAHKFHHHLPDACPFDAHHYGSGAPEEWPLLMCDVVSAGCFGSMPYCLSHPALYISWFNTYHQHTRADLPEGHADNHHADHHAMHNVNFGLFFPYELLMKTLPPKFCETVDFQGYAIRRVEQGRAVKLQFTPLGARADTTG